MGCTLPLGRGVGGVYKMRRESPPGRMGTILTTQIHALGVSARDPDNFSWPDKAGHLAPKYYEDISSAVERAWTYYLALTDIEPLQIDRLEAALREAVRLEKIKSRLFDKMYSTNERTTL